MYWISHLSFPLTLCLNSGSFLETPTHGNLHFEGRLGFLLFASEESQHIKYQKSTNAETWLQGLPLGRGKETEDKVQGAATAPCRSSKQVMNSFLCSPHSAAKTMAETIEDAGLIGLLSQMTGAPSVTAGYVSPWAKAQ